MDNMGECDHCGAPEGRPCVDVDAYVDDTGTYAVPVLCRCPHDGRSGTTTERDRAVNALTRAGTWVADVARIIDDARAAADDGDMDRAAALVRAAVTAINAVRHDVGYARIALGCARSTLT
jgi:hypothetical protein